MKPNAIVQIEKPTLLGISQSELEKVFISFNIHICSVKCSENKVVFHLRGNKESLRVAVKAIHSKALKNKKLPSSIKKELGILVNTNLYNQKFKTIASKYIQHCKNYNLAPHPEVTEGMA